MNVSTPALLLCLLVSLGSSSSWSPRPAAWYPEGTFQKPDGGWRLDPIWDDGRAEYSVYRVHWNHRGRKRSGRLTLIAVKEPWAPDLDVKADRSRPGGFDVIKLNAILDFRAGLSETHQMASIFMRRDTGRLQKLATTSMDGCGITTSDMVKGRFRTRSYFDGQGNRQQPWPKSALPEDGLALFLRDLVQGPLPARLSLFPSLLAGRLPPLKPRICTLTRKPPLTIKLGAGTFEAVPLMLKAPRQTWTFFFEKALPHRLLKLQTSQGASYELLRSERLPYWNMNKPKDRNWLPPELR